MNTDYKKQLIKEVQLKVQDEVKFTIEWSLKRLNTKEVDLTNIEKDIKSKMLELGGNILETAIKIYGTGYTKSRIKCRGCGGKMKFMNNRRKKIVTLVTEIDIRRAYYHCDCGESYIPLDKKLDIVGTKISPGVREVSALTSARLPFEESKMLLKDLTGIEISKQKIRNISEGIGLEIDNLHKEEQKKYFETGKLNKVEPNEHEYFYVSADGTSVFTDDGWKEVKTGAVFDAKYSEDIDEPIRGITSHVGGFENSEQFGERLYVESYKRGIEESKKVVFIGDGAHWIWNQRQMNFPGAVEIVDWYHATERIWDIGKLLYANDEKKLHWWVNYRIKYLKKGKIEKLIISLKHSRTSNKECKDNIVNAIGYYKNNKERMRYKEFKKKGYFIGSGVVESGCGWIVGDRLKKSSMRWSTQGGNSILQLRICVLNNRWKDFWKNRKSYCYV